MGRCRFIVALGSAIVLSAAQPANSAESTKGVTAETGSDGRQSITIDAPQGHYGEWIEDSVAGVASLRARVTSVRLGPYGRYIPVFAASVLRGDQMLMAKVYSDASWAPSVALAQLLGQNRKVRLREEMFAIALDPALPIDLTLNWTQDGAVCVLVAQGAKTEARLISLGGLPTAVSIFGSSGEFRFDAVELVPRPAGDPAVYDATIKANCVPIS